MGQAVVPLVCSARPFPHEFGQPVPGGRCQSVRVILTERELVGPLADHGSGEMHESPDHLPRRLFKQVGRNRTSVEMMLPHWRENP